MTINWVLKFQPSNTRRWIIITSTVQWLSKEYYNFNRSITVYGVLEIQLCNDRRWSIRTSTVRWLSMEYKNFFDCLMTADGVLEFFFWRIYQEDSIFYLYATILNSYWAVLLKGRDLPSFLCNDLDFQLGRSSCPVLRVPSSVRFQTKTVPFWWLLTLIWCSKFTVHYAFL